jgi:apolipoprotein N-acyltransferase
MMTITRRDTSHNEGPQETLRSRNLLLAVASGLLLALAFPPIPYGHTALIALVPFLFVIERQRSLAGAFRFSYLAFLVANAGTIYWISGWWGDDPWLKAAGVVVNLVHPLLFTIPGMLLYFIRRRLGAVAMAAGFPFLWTTWEWVAHLPELSFPWMLLANTQTYDHIGIQYITATGTFGITMWIASINALLYILVRQFSRGVWGIASRPALAMLAAVLLLVLLPKIHGTLLLGNREAPQRSMVVGIVQPDIDPYEKWGSGETPLLKLQNLLRLYDSLAQFKPDVVLMPETAIPFRILQASYREEWLELRRRVDSSGVALLTGFPHTVFYDDPASAPGSARRIPDTDIRYHDFNAALLVEAGDAAPQIYRKSRLTPLSERIPYLDAMPFLQDALTWGVGISNWGLGNDTTVFTLHNRPTPNRLWAMICYETLYPSFVSGFAARGANVFGVITNDGWFGPTSGPYQLQRYTVLRAIENRRAVARCANNGVSCFISKYGEVRQETELYTQAAILGSVECTDEITFYTRHGDWLPLGTTVATGLLLLLSFIAVHYKK